MDTTQYEAEMQSKDGVPHITVKISSTHTQRLIEHLRVRFSEPFTLTLNAGSNEQGTPYDTLNLIGREADQAITSFRTDANDFGLGA